MPVIDDIRENRKKVEGKGFKYKAQYYIQYYGVPALVVVLICAFLFSIIKSYVTAKDMEFEAIFMNAINTPDSTVFAERVGIDLEEYDVFFDDGFTMTSDPNDYSETNYTNGQKLMAVIASGSADVFVSNKDMSEAYFNAEFFGDLRDYYDASLLEELGDKVIWHAPLDPDTGEPKELKPIAIDITDSPLLKENECYVDGVEIYYSVIVNTKHPEYVKEFFNYLYD